MPATIFLPPIPRLQLSPDSLQTLDPALLLNSVAWEVNTGDMIRVWMLDVDDVGCCLNLPPDSIMTHLALEARLRRQHDVLVLSEYVLVPSGQPRHWG